MPHGQPAFKFTSEDRQAECWLISPVIHVKGNSKLMMQAFFRKSPEFKGSISMVVELTRQTGKRDSAVPQPEFEITQNFRVKEPNQPRSKNWLEARETFDLPANAHAVRLKIGGKFKGTAWVRDLRLEAPR